MTARIGNRNGPPGGSTALQRGDPELVRLEVDVAGPDRERLAHPAPGQREGLDRGLRMGPGRGQEARWGAVRYFQPRASTRLKVLSVVRPESYITLGVMTRPAVRLACSRPVLLAVAAGPRRWHLRECSRM